MPHHDFDLVDPGETLLGGAVPGVCARSLRAIDARGMPLRAGRRHRFLRPGGHRRLRLPQGRAGGPRSQTLGYGARARRRALWRLLGGAIPQAPPVIPPNDVKRVIYAFELLEEGATAPNSAPNSPPWRSWFRPSSSGWPRNIYPERAHRRPVDAHGGDRACRRDAGPADRRFSRRRHGAPGHQYKEIVEALDGFPRLTRLWSA